MILEHLEVQSCCYVVSLRTGTKIFGFLSLLACVFDFVYAVLHIASIARYVPVELENVAINESINITVLCVHMGTSVLLLLGVYQSKAKFIPPWLISSFVLAIWELVFVQSIIHEFFAIGFSSYTQYIIFSLFTLVDDVCGMIVVFSYYRSLLSPSPVT